MLDTDTPSRQTFSSENRKSSLYSERADTIESLASRYPEILSVEEALKRAHFEARRALGLHVLTEESIREDLIREITPTEDGYNPNITLNRLMEAYG